VLGKKKRSVIGSRRPPPRPQVALRIPFPTLIRTFLLGMVAVIASLYAIWRHYTIPRPSLLTPTPSATEIEIEIDPGP
jgi:hypothetical protein